MEHQPSITYTLVARNVVILAEQSATMADYSLVTAPILEYLTTHPADVRQRIFTHAQHHIHILPREGLIFLAVADSVFSASVVNGMLEELANKFIETYGKGYEMPKINIPYAMNEFSKTMATMMQEWSGKAALLDPVVRTQQELEQVQDILVVNIEKLLARGDTLQSLDERTDKINQTALEFQRKSTVLRRSMWWKNRKLMTGTTISIILLIFMVSGLVHGK
jgi:vesicle-associated membrane protein 7